MGAAASAAADAVSAVSGAAGLTSTDKSAAPAQQSTYRLDVSDDSDDDFNLSDDDDDGGAAALIAKKHAEAAAATKKAKPAARSSVIWDIKVSFYPPFFLSPQSPSQALTLPLSCILPISSLRTMRQIWTW